MKPLTGGSSLGRRRALSASECPAVIETDGEYGWYRGRQISSHVQETVHGIFVCPARDRRPGNVQSINEEEHGHE